MAVKTFTTGEVLTASDTNTYLANSGLVYVSTYTISGTPTSFSITGFPTTYDDFVLIFKVKQNAGNLTVSIGGTASGHYGTQYYDLYTGATTGANRTNNGAWWRVAVNDNTGSAYTTVTLYNLTATAQTGVVSNYYGNGYSGWSGGAHITSSSYTSITVSADAGGAFTAGGTVTIYGMRKV